MAEEDDDFDVEEEKNRRRKKLRKKREKQDEDDEDWGNRKVGRLKPFDPSSRRFSWKELVEDDDD
jgi:hypothetical protein